MQGYTVFDIDNAFKINMAYQVFNKCPLSENVVSEFKKMSSENSMALYYYFRWFVADEIIPDLQDINEDEKYGYVKQHQIIGDFFQSDLWKSYSKKETQESFLDFCLLTGNIDIDYWEKVYSRLGLVWDKLDRHDQITICIEEKEMFQKQFLSYGVIGNSVSGAKKIKEAANDTKHGYSLTRMIFINIIGLSLLCLGVFLSYLRVAIFIVIIFLNLFKLYLLKRDLSFSEKTINISTALLLLVGVLWPSVGFYIAIFLTVGETLKTLCYEIKRYKNKNKSQSIS